MQTATGTASATTDLMQTDLDAIAIIAPDDDGALDDIWQYDGTGGVETRPDFVKQDDERIGVKKGKA